MKASKKKKKKKKEKKRKRWQYFNKLKSRNRGEELPPGALKSIFFIGLTPDHRHNLVLLFKSYRALPIKS